MKKAFNFLGLAIFCLCFAVIANAQENNSAKQSEKDRPLKILKKPPPQLGNCPQSSGFTSLKVKFDKSGKVTDAEIIKSSNCRDFDENAIDAAKRIKFETAMKDGEPITVFKVVEYAFRKY